MIQSISEFIDNQSSSNNIKIDEMSNGFPMTLTVIGLLLEFEFKEVTLQV